LLVGQSSNSVFEEEARNISEDIHQYRRTEKKRQEPTKYWSNRIQNWN